MASKRKHDGEGYGQTEQQNTKAKCRRELYGGDPMSVPRDRFEMTHLYRTNQEMADFVRESVVVMHRQQAEIERLYGIINNLRAKNNII